MVSLRRSSPTHSPKSQRKKVLNIELFAAGSWQGENGQEEQEI